MTMLICDTDRLPPQTGQVDQIQPKEVHRAAFSGETLFTPSIILMITTA